ncbi:hypothetical protein SAMN05192534_11347 [Alteribacillus persepolensis]|uniref:CopC domain-containing protein n=1 Tax=Alteribacillus persepolensis TaxID=568899 RepID=A0A1G8FVW9_9BACI|nr:copper resistance CopC family protein [Alteribacillus persepolensis]SDH86294.1 hypothetical protein SAMN05192534_11347 [Alteribacillus persepolensis]
MKRFLLSCVVGLVAFPTAAGAHTHLESADPEEGSILEETTTITLSFDSMVQETNTMVLIDESGNELELDEIRHNPEDTIDVQLPEAMNEGEYTLFYSIVGEDGHVMEDELSYTYEASEEESESGSESEREESISSEEASPEEEEQVTQPEEAEDNGNGVLLPATIGLIVIAAGFIIFFSRKKRS